MANIFEVLDFPNTFFGAERSLYNAQRSGVKTREEVGIKDYLSRDVDFYSTGLAKSTGINVSDPDRWSDEDDEDDEEENKNKVNVNVVGGSDNNETDATGPIGSDLSSGLSENISVNSGMASLGTGYTPYGQSLQNAGFGDRSNSFLSQNFGISLAADVSKQGAKSSLSNMTTAKSLAERAAKTTAAVLGFNPIATNLLSGFITGRTVQDPLGKPSYRPNHSVLGTVMDVNYSIQSTNIAASIAAMNANAGKPLSQRSPVGFFGYINGQVVSKGPKTNWTGTTSLSNTQLNAINALSKGYAPYGFNTQTERGSRSIVGDTTSSSTGYGGYDDNGYHHSINGISAQGSMAQASVAASKAGITTSQMVTALKEARKNRTWMGKTINPKKTLTFQIQKQFRDHSSSQSGSGSMGLETDVNAQKGIQDALSKGIGVNEFGGVSQDTLSDVQNINASNPGIGTSTGAGAVGSTGGLSETYGGGSEGTDSNDSNSSDMGGMTAKGGFIGKKNFALGGRGDAEPAGFIGGPPENYNDQTTIADDIPLKVQDGTFVINAPAVEYAGSIDVQKMLAEGYEKAMTRDIGVDKNFKIGKIPSREELDIQISRGEVVVPPHVAKAIGYDRLEKINNRGKREVERRQKAGNQEKVQAGQGFAATGGKQVSIADIKKQFKKKYSNEDFARKQIAKLVRSLPPEDALALAMYSEANVLGEEGLEGVAHVVMNRVNAADSKGNRYRNFGKNVYDTLLAKYTGSKGKKIFEFNGLEPTGFRDAMDALVNNEEKYLKIRNIAEDVFRGSRKDFTKGSLYYYNPYTTTSDWYKGQVKTGQFKEIYRTLNPDKKQNKSLHVYHVPVDDYFVEKQIEISPQVTPTEDFKSLDTLPQPKSRPKEVEDRSDDNGGFIDYLRKLF